MEVGKKKRYPNIPSKTSGLSLFMIHTVEIGHTAISQIHWSDLHTSMAVVLAIKALQYCYKWFWSRR